MPEFKILSPFRDKETGEAYIRGEVREFADSRAREIVEAGDFLEKVAEKAEEPQEEIVEEAQPTEEPQEKEEEPKKTSNKKQKPATSK
ncbi:hypothetical protein [Listeria ilorinensis]|uniref:hypothetical protein n=1 Tax=Listeria ilorinensis TaxID=2867439 RepID=UPI001EF619C7|nr:hypothetical protein [Listeria ilorinensis]